MKNHFRFPNRPPEALFAEGSYSKILPLRCAGSQDDKAALNSYIFRTLLVWFILLTGVFASTCEAGPIASHAAQAIPIQHAGRVKSFEAFSRQTVEFITTKESWQRQPAVNVILKALSNKNDVANWPWVRVSYKPLLAELGLPADKQYFSYHELVNSFDKIETLVKKSQTKRDQDLRPSKLEQEAESLFSKLMEVKHLFTGESILVVPPSNGEVWTSPYKEESLLAANFKALMSLYGEKDQAAFSEKVKAWTNNVHELTGGKFRRAVDLEARYYAWRPFQNAWIAYLAAFLIFTFSKKKHARVRALGIAILAWAIFFHTLGLILRVVILNRPPVSNMYESMIFMNWILIVTAVAFSILKKNSAVISIGALISAIVMIYGNLLPIETNLEVLTPVLRSNYWLTMHVMTIVASYGIFALAMGLGHRVLFLHFINKMTKEEEKRSDQVIYRTIEIGALLLGIGTVLGGVWANESWGRFWGWDPKETWALITFLGYLILIHLKHAKLIKPYTLAVSAILGFLLVLMTWYGVNFVLGRGLHSYGQGSGGMIWVIYYLIFEALFLGMALLKKRSHLPRKKHS